MNWLRVLQSGSIAGWHLNNPIPPTLNATEWSILVPLIPAAQPGGRPEAYPKRTLVATPSGSLEIKTLTL
jgi:hypothetical protein